MAPAQGWHAQFEKKFQHFFLFQISGFDSLTWQLFQKWKFFRFLLRFFFTGLQNIWLWTQMLKNKIVNTVIVKTVTILSF